jgi:hypothetical protein
MFNFRFLFFLFLINVDTDCLNVKKVVKYPALFGTITGIVSLVVCFLIYKIFFSEKIIFVNDINTRKNNIIFINIEEKCFENNKKDCYFVVKLKNNFSGKLFFNWIYFENNFLAKIKVGEDFSKYSLNGKALIFNDSFKTEYLLGEENNNIFEDAGIPLENKILTIKIKNTKDYFNVLEKEKLIDKDLYKFTKEK